MFGNVRLILRIERQNLFVLPAPECPPLGRYNNCLLDGRFGDASGWNVDGPCSDIHSHCVCFLRRPQIRKQTRRISRCLDTTTLRMVIEARGNPLLSTSNLMTTCGGPGFQPKHTQKQHQYLNTFPCFKQFSMLDWTIVMKRVKMFSLKTWACAG
jgi:hypothetical protein